MGVAPQNRVWPASHEDARDQEKLSVAVVEDRSDHAMLLERQLPHVIGQGVQVIRLVNMASLEVAAESWRPDLVLLDLNLPDSRGIETVQRAHRLLSPAPIIVLTGMDDEALAEEALREGAEDYIAKPISDLAQLRRAIRYTLERQRYRRSLEESEAKFRSLAERLQAALFIYRRPRFIYCNPAAERLTGYTKVELLNMSPRDLLPADRQESEWHRFTELLDGRGESSRYETQIEQPDGEKRWVDIALTRTVMDGEPVLLGTAIDMTEHKRSEQRLREARDELQESYQVLQHTQMALTEAAKMESVGRLAAGVAHEVKNPLQIVSMGLDYLDRHRPGTSDTISMVLHDMRGAVERADHIVNGLLDFSSVTKLDLQLGDIEAALRESLQLARFHLTRHHIQVVEDLQAVPDILMDYQKVCQVFVNLIMNAVHAMADGGTLTLTCHTEKHPAPVFEIPELPPDVQLVMVSIEDTGGGIPEEELSKIFDPFYTKKAPGKGTGLGLAVCRHILHLHGGRIVIDNVRGGARARMLFVSDPRELPM